MSSLPMAGQIWQKVDSGDRYEILSDGKQKEVDRQWYPSVVYRSAADGKVYSRRADSFQAEFSYLAEAPAAAEDVVALVLELRAAIDGSGPLSELGHMGYLDPAMERFLAADLECLQRLVQQPTQVNAEALLAEGAACEAESDAVFKASMEDQFGLAHSLSMLAEMLGKQARYIGMVALWRERVEKARALAAAGAQA